MTDSEPNTPILTYSNTPYFERARLSISFFQRKTAHHELQINPFPSKHSVL